MSDCDNIEMRDGLPELAAGALAALRAAELQAHVDGCESCRTELLLIHSVRVARSGVRTHRVDVGAIVRALPAPPRRTAAAVDVIDIASRRRPRSFPVQWRAAAAAVVVAAGSIGAYIARPSVAPQSPIVAQSLPAAPSTSPATSPTPAAVASASPAPTAPPVAHAPLAPAVPRPGAPALLVAGAAHDLPSADQAKLLRELEAFDGKLAEDPETARYDFGVEGL